MLIVISAALGTMYLREQKYIKQKLLAITVPPAAQVQNLLL
jgi:hypothetical protein